MIRSVFQVRHGLWRDSFANSWQAEILAILCSLVSFCVITAILLRFDDKPLPQLPYNVPLSFVISSLAEISKGALLLVVAS